MKRLDALGLLLLVLAGCEPEAGLEAAPASLVEDAGVWTAQPVEVKPAPPPTEADLRTDKLKRDITQENALVRARALEAVLDEEIKVLQLRLAPVDVDMGGE